jgi:peptidyl-prolyl cis-trans isomerase C
MERQMRELQHPVSWRSDSSIGPGTHFVVPGRLLRTALLTTIITGCGMHHSPGSGGSQVVVKVNDKEITINQVNVALDSIDAEQITPELTRSAVDRLVNEELLVQAALKNNLDRDPTVVQSMESARRQVLAQSFAARAVYAKAPPAAAEENDYYKRNPVLFEERRIFQVTAFAVAGSDLTDKVRAALDGAHDADQVRDVFDKHEIRYSAQSMSIVPEQLPVERLPLFAQAKVGDLLITDQPGGQQLLMCVTSTQDSPVSLEHARPLIRRYLVNQQHEAAMEAFLKQTKATAKITFVRDLGAPKAAASGKPPTEDRVVVADGEPDSAHAAATAVGQ